ncbi:hypothetical protein MTR67_047316 [Solanum verrucosum]|uniref:Reverse transcriptase zinc-binding domain-containing protein n=1 Tax=Solanum verrucosum TaxID=315347 RepID=A0AAF0UZ43_SOLVR|nr:hypothetical protein MTR67_047316 [Solanum verrucosum]
MILRRNLKDWEIPRILELFKVLENFQGLQISLEANLEDQSATQSGMLNVAKRGISLCNRCSLCGKATETARHLFLHCNFTEQLWQIFLNHRGISWSMPSKIDETLFSREMAGTGVGATNKERWRMILACIWWAIRRERNDRCFENRNK